MKIRTVHDFRRAVRQGPYAWPGGYPLLFWCDDGEALCCDCAKTERRHILEAIRDNSRSDQWRVTTLQMHMEGAPEQCAHCGTHIESAYGDPEAEEV